VVLATIVYLSGLTEFKPTTEVLVPVFHLNGVVLSALSQAATASAKTEPSTERLHGPQLVERFLVQVERAGEARNRQNQKPDNGFLKSYFLFPPPKDQRSERNPHQLR
jgi:hypothetical protein